MDKNIKKISFISIHPNFIQNYFDFGVFKKAQDLNLATFNSINLRNYAVDQHGSVDDKPYGGGAGMILRPEPLAAATKIVKSTSQNLKTILLSPRGTAWNQKLAYEYTDPQIDLLFVCGRFEGIDQRYIDLYVDATYSIGPYIIAGGELAALTVCESIIRLLPNLLKEDSKQDSDKYSIDPDNHNEWHPYYTRPASFEGLNVPADLLSGDPKIVAKWKSERKLKFKT